MGSWNQLITAVRGKSVATESGTAVAQEEGCGAGAGVRKPSTRPTEGLALGADTDFDSVLTERTFRFVLERFGLGSVGPAEIR